jgi:hypothetical protein
MQIVFFAITTVYGFTVHELRCNDTPHAVIFGQVFNLSRVWHGMDDASYIVKVLAAAVRMIVFSLVLVLQRVMKWLASNNKLMNKICL